MKELKKRLLELEHLGYENIGIIQVLNWIHEIEIENRLRAFNRYRKQQ